MNKKVITIAVSIICLLAMMLVTIGYLFEQEIITLDNIIKNESELSTDNFQEGSALYELAYLKLGANCNIGCGETNEPINVKFNSIEVTKQRGDFDIVDSWKEIKDDNGNITNDFSYVVCNITIKNKGVRSYENGINNLYLSFGKENGYTDARAYNSNRTNTDVTDYFIVTFEPGMEYNYNVAYIVSDEEIEKYKDKMMIKVEFNASLGMVDFPIIEKEQGWNTVNKVES